jgi:DNA-binding transcriptional LysR family regulator
MALEQRLQGQLFFRTTRQVTPTPIGRAFAERCRSMINDRENAIAMLGEHGVPQGALRISCPVALGERYIAPLLQRFLERYPKLEGVLDLAPHDVDIVAQGYDLAIRFGEVTNPNLIATRIASRHLRLCASPDYLARSGEPKSVNDLITHTCLIGESEVWRFREGERAIEFRPKGRWQCNNNAVIAEAAVSGQGICQLPDFHVRAHLEVNALTQLLVDRTPPGEPIWAVYPCRQHLQPKVRLFIDLLRAEISEAYKARYAAAPA